MQSESETKAEPKTLTENGSVLGKRSVYEEDIPEPDAAGVYPKKWTNAVLSTAVVFVMGHDEKHYYFESEKERKCFEEMVMQAADDAEEVIKTGGVVISPSDTDVDSEGSESDSDVTAV